MTGWLGEIAIPIDEMDCNAVVRENPADINARYLLLPIGLYKINPVIAVPTTVTIFAETFEQVNVRPAFPYARVSILLMLYLLD